MKRLMAVCLVAVPALIMMSQVARSNETIIYEYDALGRLNKSTTSKTEGGTASAFEFDSVGNRKSLTIAPSIPITSTSGGTSGGETTPPVARNPFYNLRSGQIITITIDALATGTPPLSVVQFLSGSVGGIGTIAADGQSVSYEAPYLSAPPYCGEIYWKTLLIGYSVQNGSGQTATGVVKVIVQSSNPQRPRPNSPPCN